MEYIDGIKLSDVEKIKQANLSLKEVDAKLVEAMAFQIFHSGFVHADPHVCFFSFSSIETMNIFSQEMSMYEEIQKLQRNRTFKSFYSIMVYM
jgi:predicted unusual protein kinase regulating ubiquinone biosynthesis (AarF/ABC1/UbiB family)